MKVLPDIIGKSIEAEIHPDYHKGDDDKRHIENGHGDDILVHRFYGACDIEGNLYRVKTTMLEFRDENRTNRPHSYEVTKIELLDGLSNSPRREMVGSNPSISAAKLLNNVETTKDKEKKTLDYLSISAPIAEARDNQEFISAAKLQQNFEIIKLSSKKELPPVLPLGTNRRGISKAAHGAALLSELSSTEEPGCSELLRPAVCSFRTIASVLRRLESRFSSHCRKLCLPQTHPDIPKYPDTPIQHSPVDGGASQ